MSEPETASRPRRLAPFCLGLFGIVLPLAALIWELRTGASAEQYLDPIPTPWHALLILSVPMTSALALVAGRLPGAMLFPARVLVGLALTVASLYALAYAPIAPFAAVMVLFGIGALPLAPLLSVLALLIARSRFLARARELGRSPTPLAGVLGVLVGLGAPVALGMATYATTAAMAMAHHKDPEKAQRGMELLRRVGSASVLRGLCETQAPSVDLGQWFRRGSRDWTQATARESYYRLTGRPWYADPRPTSGWISRPRPRTWAEAGFRDWDPAQGSERVGPRLDDLSLVDSRLDARADGPSSTVYWEWTLAFENTGWLQREARMVLALPPGGVVSRLTLWVDGEEREAAFAGHSQVRQAYEAVVVRQRDPVLATVAGPDRVLVQCFPVQPTSRADTEPVAPMQIRVGITAPIVPLDLARGRAAFPTIAEHNFDLGQVAHHLWVESSAEAIRWPGGVVASPEGRPGEFVARGTLAAESLVSGLEPLLLSRDAATDPIVSRPLDGGAFIRQTWRRLSDDPTPRLTVVVDGSATLAPFGTAIRDALVGLPSSIPLDVWFAGDRALRLGREGLGALGQAERFVGGQDSAPALEAALDALPLDEPGAVLWIHGPQAVLLTGTAGIVQNFERRQRPLRLVTLSTSSYPNELAHGLYGASSIAKLGVFETVPRFGDLEQDLWSALDRLRGEPYWQAERLRLTQPEHLLAQPGSSHVTRLWAAEEIERLARSSDAHERERAVELAASHQLVTSVSGAVVLETAAQYEAADLEPVSADSVPTVPEPGEWALIALAVLVVGGVLLRERPRQRIAT
ncbi:hypothetical protein [Engelhardtia mirabilis]|uniref:VIT domain-containing protein n=1 Tax=Engelhardtia mirabilis TaxID=2528011 RepID=A0A518BQR8_9BACT|nr:hypothetical protein Pla133_44340 [Planctomycetes bacterium Pla133]QDV03641.1 hypothetical protein Pla86_44320 [Planctomycetes bacterium Pla86]